jgi:hypothetical protein
MLSKERFADAAAEFISSAETPPGERRGRRKSRAIKTAASREKPIMKR